MYKNFLRFFEEWEKSPSPSYTPSLGKGVGVGATPTLAQFHWVTALSGKKGWVGRQKNVPFGIYIARCKVINVQFNSVQ